MSEEMKTTEDLLESMRKFNKFLEMYEVIKQEVSDKENLLNCLLETISLDKELNGGLVEHIKRKIKVLQEEPKEGTITADLRLDPEKGLVDKEGNVFLDKEKSLKTMGLDGITAVINDNQHIGIKVEEEDKK